MINSPVKTRVIYFLYRLGLVAAIPLLVLYFVLRVRRDRKYLRFFRERLGLLRFSYERTAAGAIWLHAVSVGEVISAVGLIKAFKTAYPLAPVFVSCATVAGRSIADDRLKGLATAIFYAPLDYVACVRRVLRKLRPSLVVVMETEIWPNLYREAKNSGASLAIVNGRISDRTFPRYKPWRWFFETVLAFPDLILVQSEQDLVRYRSLGAPPDRIGAAGNLKYDFAPSEAEIPVEIRSFLEALHPRQIWISASTMPPRDARDVDEDDIVLGEYLKVVSAIPNLLMILAPRRPDRFDIVASKLEQAGIPFVRRTTLPSAAVPALPCVLLLDSMGELSRMFAIADVVFMGGTFPRRGGHNILEPAYFGKAVIAGPHMENFAEIAREFTESGALLRVNESADLSRAVVRLLDNDRERHEIGSRARVLAASKRGVTVRIVDRLLRLYFDTLPLRRGSPVLAPLAALWERGVQSRKSRALTNARRLDRSVISVGGIAMGGVGKTPFAAWLSSELKAAGLQPAILTRGYRRRSIERIIVLRAGTAAPADLTGDEPQTYLRKGDAHLGIGAERYEVGRALLEKLEADAFILDDGFQHWRLARDVDIVLIDALDPFGRGAIFPRGRLREPLCALERASIFVITRCEPGLNTDAIEREIRRWNPNAPILRSRVVMGHWVDLGTGRRYEKLPIASAVAFCGLANPRTFWATLQSLDIDIRSRWSFGDHHKYRNQEIRRLSRRARKQGAAGLVTTEKDAANLEPTTAQLAEPLPIFALEIGIEVEGRERLLEFIHNAMAYKT